MNNVPTILTAILVTAISLMVTVITTFHEPGADARCYLDKTLRFLDSRYSGWSCLHYASSFGEIDRVARMLGEGAFVSAKSEAGKTPLYEAAKTGMTEVVRLLHSNGGSVLEGTFKQGFTPLHVAVEYNHHDTARYLLSLGVDPNVRNRHGQTPLWQAAWRYSDRDMIKLLIEAGAQSKILSDKGFSPLHMAAKHGRVDAIMALAELGVDLNIETPKGTTPIMYAAKHGSLESVTTLVNLGARFKTRKGQWSALRAAEKYGHSNVADYLRNAGAVDTLETHGLFKEGLELYQSGNFEEALSKFESWQELNQSSSRAHYHIGRSYLKMNDYASAEQSLLRARELDRLDLEVLESLAWVQLHMGKDVEAISTYAIILQNDPGDAKALHNQAGLYARQGLQDKAYQNAHEACQLGYEPACGVLSRLKP